MFVLGKIGRFLTVDAAGACGKRKRRTCCCGGYSIARSIGTGGFGRVHECSSSSDDDELFAVKILNKTRSGRSDEFTARRIRDEINVMRSLSGCPQVAGFVDTCEDLTHVYIVMELCRGGDLNAYVKRRGALGEPALREVADQVLRMLSTCHARGIVYGDVKPANFCIVDPIRPTVVKTVDFGCSRYVVEEGRRFDTLSGTPAFMAPEVFKRSYSYKSDIYSLGVMLYWLSSQRFPLLGKEIESMSMREIDALRTFGDVSHDLRRRLGPVLSPEAVDFIGMCLMPEARRPSATDALNSRWISRTPPPSTNTLID